jgi:hypothetical protein
MFFVPANNCPPEALKEKLKMKMPGFTAEISLCKTSGYYQCSMREIAPTSSQAVMLQFSLKSIVCGAVVAAVLAGQEVMVSVCSDSA